MSSRMNKDKKIVLRSLEEIQKDIFKLKSPENDLILLYVYPTSQVDSFYKQVEKLFRMKFEARPNTLSEMADIILKKINKSWRI